VDGTTSKTMEERIDSFEKILNKLHTKNKKQKNEQK